MLRLFHDHVNKRASNLTLDADINNMRKTQSNPTENMPSAIQISHESYPVPIFGSHKIHPMLSRSMSANSNLSPERDNMVDNFNLKISKEDLDYVIASRIPLSDISQLYRTTSHDEKVQRISKSLPLPYQKKEDDGKDVQK